MFDSLSIDLLEFMSWSWSQIEPYYQDLEKRTLTEANAAEWLADWTRLDDLVSETYARLNIAVTQDTTDPQAEARYNAFLDGVYQPVEAAEQRLKEKLLASGLEPQGFALPLRKMRAEAAIFRQANLPLLVEERKLASQYNRIIGAQTITWEGREVTLQQIRHVFHSTDRAERERAWRMAATRQLADRGAINALWAKFMDLRGRLAANAGFPNYLAYRWQQMLRLDYTPEDGQRFQRSIEQVVVPTATRMYEKYRRRLGVDRLRPWDLDLDLYPVQFPPLPSMGSTAELEQGAAAAFRQVDPKLGDYFAILRREKSLDLDNRKGKAPGAYCQTLPASKRPFIFMNAVGLAEDVRTILHETGHAFHSFEASRLPYSQQRHPGLEFAEVASMGMELLASPYLSAEQGGFFATEDTARFRAGHLERILAFWPYMAVVDAFQHWVYTHHAQASDPASCDAAWLEQWNRFIPGVDWGGLEDEAMTGWHRKQHIHRYPLYYIEYGLAQLGAVQVWRNALADQHRATERYLQALALGGTATLPELYRTAGAKFAFDAETLGEATALVEQVLGSLESDA